MNVEEFKIKIQFILFLGCGFNKRPKLKQQLHQNQSIFVNQ